MNYDEGEKRDSTPALFCVMPSGAYPIQGAIFDVDGTLLDSMSVWATIGGDFLRSRGITPKEDLDRRFKNISMQQSARIYKEEYGLPESEQTLIDQINAMIYDFYAHKAKAKPGAKSFVAALSRRGVRMCLATVTDRHLVEAALERNGLLEYFDEVFTGSSVGHGKDEPHIFNAALKFLGTEKACTWVFEDALYAVRTAKAAGFPVAVVHDTFEQGAEEMKDLAEIYVNDFTSLEGLLA